MAKFHVTSPSGEKFEITAPDDATDDQVLAYAKSQFDQPKQAKPNTRAMIDNDPISQGARNFTNDMTGTQKFLAGAGKGLTDAVLGVGQFMGMVPQSDIDEVRKTDAPLLKTGAGTAGNLVGGVAAAAPTILIPGVNTLTGAALVGAGTGLLQPVATGESRTLNTALGAGAGLVGQGVGNAVGRAIRPVDNVLNQEEARLAAQAIREGIPLTAAQKTGSKPLKVMDAAMENMPFTASKQAAVNQGQEQAFNRAVLSRAGIKDDLATPDVLGTRKKALGKEFETIAGRNAIDFNQGVLGDLATTVQNANRRLTPDQFKGISNTVDDILSQLDASGKLLGTNYQGWRSELGRLSKGNDSQAHYYAEIKKSLDKAFNSQISGADSQGWKQASREYGSLKTILDAMGGPGTGPNIGNIAPAQLSGAVARQVSKEGKALGRGELTDLSKIGQAFVKPQVPNSGTAQRMFAQQILTGSVGAGAGYAGGGDPQSAAMGAGLVLGGPRAVQALMQSGLGQRYLTSGLLGITPKHRAAINHALRTGLLGTPVYEAVR
jgi:hypothetical protein